MKIYSVEPMLKNTALFTIIALLAPASILSFSMPKFYHAHIFNDETRFSEPYLTTIDLLVGGGGKDFCHAGKTGRLDMTELYVEAYQNFSHGLFFHLFLPTCWVKQKMVHTIGTIGPLEPCLHQTNIYSPTVLAGWTINYENNIHVDFVDATLQAGFIGASPRNTVRGPLFPVGYSTSPGFAAHAALAVGYVEWLTTGVFAQTLVYSPAVIWSSGVYIKADHIFPALSFTVGIAGDGQNKTLNCITPWNMLSMYGDIELDLATDNHSYLPCLKAFFAGALAGNNVVKTALAGAHIGCDISWCW